MKLNAVITTTKPTQQSDGGHTCELQINHGNNLEWLGNLHARDLNELESISAHLCAVPEMIKAIDLWVRLRHTTEPLSVDDYKVLADRLDEYMVAAQTKANSPQHGA